MPVIVGLLVCVPAVLAVVGVLGNSATRRRTRFPALGHWSYDPRLRPPERPTNINSNININTEETP